ncbi:hypothetical protein ALC60_01033, partial [Trachymyrmex zeteki]
IVGMYSRSGPRGLRGIDCRSIGTQNEYQRREIGETPEHNPNTIGGDRAHPLAVLQSQYRYPIRRAIRPEHTGARRCARLKFPVRRRSLPVLRGDAGDRNGKW